MRGDLTSGLGRSPGVGNGNLLQYSCLGNPLDRGAWWATVHGVTKSCDRAQWICLFQLWTPRCWAGLSRAAVSLSLQRRERAQAQQLRRQGGAAPRPVGSSRTRGDPVSPALAGRFLSTGSPGKSFLMFCFCFFVLLCLVKNYYKPITVQYSSVANCVNWVPSLS